MNKFILCIQINKSAHIVFSSPRVPNLHSALDLKLARIGLSREGVFIKLTHGQPAETFETKFAIPKIPDHTPNHQRKSDVCRGPTL